jgi:hypothetical protein
LGSQRVVSPASLKVVVLSSLAVSQVLGSLLVLLPLQPRVLRTILLLPYALCTHPSSLRPK